MDKTSGGNEMIDYEYLNDGTIIRHFSTLGVKLLQIETGELYDDATDIVPCPFTYEETALSIETDNEEGEEQWQDL
jgi:hypothetical protein